MMLVFIAGAAGVAFACHHFSRNFVVACAAAALLATLLWFALTLPFALADGWRGWGEEFPHVARAWAICLGLGGFVAVVVGAVMRVAGTGPMKGSHEPAQG